MEFTHFDRQGNARMVDVGDKEDTRREAVARGSIFLNPECFEQVAQGAMKKGTCWPWPGRRESWGPRRPGS